MAAVYVDKNLCIATGRSTGVTLGAGIKGGEAGPLTFLIKVTPWGVDG